MVYGIMYCKQAHDYSYLHFGIFSSAFLLWHTEKCVHYIQYLKSILCFYSLEIGNTEIYKKKNNHILQ